ncbi:MAG: exodeoxyribonuclease VII large subunit [Prevotella salivae]|nr:exodeoxyribonuclease VII large subunit [Segatella salivae]
MKALSLFELNNLVREVISTAFDNEYWVEAELSELREVRGHCYMELIQKELFSNTPVAKASAKCWKNKWQILRPKFEKVSGQHLHAGLKVMLKVYPDFHEAYGFSWIVTDINPEFTMGDMARKRLEIVKQLQAEGIFDLQKELELPLFAQRIAVISSANAAGYGDFCHQLNDNSYGLKFYTRLFPAVMQGEEIEQSVIAALNKINQRMDDFDVVVIIRGGGATSDMSGFDTLSLSENVANFPLPVITGIGHDRDESVLDMVSHTRVKTPTAAAAFLVDHLEEVYERVLDAQTELLTSVRHRMEMEKAQLQHLGEKIPMLFSLYKERQETMLDHWFQALTTAIQTHLVQETHRLEQLKRGIKPSIEQQMMRENYHLSLLSQRVKSLDPTLLLHRGYSMTMLNGRIVKDKSLLKSGDEIETILENGTIQSIIK